MATGIATFDDLMTGLKKQKGVTNNVVQLGAGAQGQPAPAGAAITQEQRSSNYAAYKSLSPEDKMKQIQSITGASPETTGINTQGAGAGAGAGAVTPENGVAGTAVEPTNGQSGPMNYGQQADQYLQQLQSLMGDTTPYNPDTDPVYQSLQAKSQRDAQTATNKGLADLNRRGISGGSIAQNQTLQLQHDANQNVQDLIPGLAQNFQAGRDSKIGNLTQLFNTLTGKDQYERSFDIQEAGVTGNYMPDELENIFAEILGTKKAVIGAEKGSSEYQGHVDNNAKLYDQLASMGIDPSFINGNVGYEDAQKAIAGFKNPTVNMQNILYGKEQDQKAFDYKTEQDQKAFDYKIATDEWDRGFKISQEQWNQYADQERLNDADATRGNTEAWRGHLKDLDLTEKQGNDATNGSILRIQGLSSREDAMQYLENNQEDLRNDGANIEKLLNAINKEWPNPLFQKKDDNGPIDVNDVVNP